MESSLTTTKPRFVSILAARANHVRPSDLEVKLRGHCQKLRVSENLSGAHFVFPSESSLAVRAYYPSDIATVEEASSSDEIDDIDDIVHFSRQFRLSIVLFVLSHDQEQLDRLYSFMHRVQRVLETGGTNTSTRVIVVSSTQQAIAAITSVADAVRPSTTKLKREFFDRQQHQQRDILSTASAFRKWSHQQGLVVGDADLLIRFLPNLSTIARSDLHGVPCDPKTKLFLRSLFHETENSPAAERSHVPSSPNDQSSLMSSPCAGWTMALHNATGGAHLSGERCSMPSPMYRQPTTMALDIATPSYSHVSRAPLPYSVPAYHSSDVAYCFPSTMTTTATIFRPYFPSSATFEHGHSGQGGGAVASHHQYQCGHHLARPQYSYQQRYM